MASVNNFESNPRLVLGYPVLLVTLMWSIHLIYISSGFPLYEWGILPRDISGLRGLIFSPLIHSQEDLKHILSNSLPIAVLLASLIHFYKKIALKVLFSIWIFGGLGTWLIARENYHIGMSGVIYGLVAFLFFSGAFRKYKPLLGLSLFVTFLYGSLIWGVFPTEERISWEGHLSGAFVGLLVAWVFRKEGPQTPKLGYEIEKELGIEPRDFEQEWREAMAREEEERKRNEQQISDNPQITFTYHIKKSEPKNKDSESPGS